MGPRPRGRGVEVQKIVTQQAAAELQWGRARAGAESPRATADITCSLLLQWGRARAGAESRAHQITPHPLCIASMGPRPRGRGVLLTNGEPTAELRLASMGPRPRGRGVEKEKPRYVPPTTELQWGRARAGAESAAAARRAILRGMASMGPRPRGRGV